LWFPRNALAVVLVALEVELEHESVTCPFGGAVDPAGGDSLVTMAPLLVHDPSETPVSPRLWSWLFACPKVSPVRSGTKGAAPLEMTRVTGVWRETEVPAAGWVPTTSP
jgi:hypothetical protein